MSCSKKITFFLLLPFFVFSQKPEKQTTYNDQKQVAFKELNVSHGLSQNSVVSISQDSIGYLWFATQDGLNRYDGKTFKHYNKQFEDITKFGHSNLGKVYTDNEGNIWIVSISGVLEKYNSKTDSFTSVKRFKNASSIFQDKNKNIYIGTYGNGLHKIAYKTKDTIQLLKPKDLNTNSYSFLESDDNIFVACSNKILSINKNGNYTTITNNPNINFSSIAYNETNLIFGTFGNGIYNLNKKNGTLNKLEIQSKLPKNLNVQSLLIDKKNRLWVATYGEGLFLVDLNRNTVRQFKAQKTNPYALHYNDVLSLFEDYTGTIWLGTDGAGLSYYDENLIKFNVLTNAQTPKNINVDVIRAITVDKKGMIWLGTSGHGLTSVNKQNNSYKTYATNNSKIASNRVMSLLSDDNNLWIGFQGEGLSLLDKKGNFKTFKAFSGYTIWKIFKDTQNRIWLCTRDHGLIQFNKETNSIKTLSKSNTGLTSNNIRTIEQLENDTFYLGTENSGLFKLNTSTLKTEHISNVSKKIKALYFNSNDKELWIGTNGNGLEVLNKNNTLKSFTTKEGLPNNVVYGILPDDMDNLWLSSNRGISKFNKDAVKNYNNFDGLQALEFNTGAYFKDKSGYLYFGGLEGLNWFKPSQLTSNPKAPKTVITSLEVFSKSEEIIPNKKFKHNQNTITFSFAGLHYSLPERNNYMYQLVNHDEDWIQSGNNSFAHYTNLEPNTYTFKVKSSNYDNVWNPTPATYSFTIKQPWYLTTLAKIIYSLLLIATLIALYYYLKWRWHIKMQLQLEHAETERLKKLDEFKTKLYTNISHEFRTPLTLISGPIEEQLLKPKISKEDKASFTLIQRNSKRLLNLVNQLLDLSKLESGSLTLKVSEGNISNFLEQIVSAFEYKAKEKNISFDIKISKIKTAWFDKDVIEKIVTNLLLNAVKYTPENGTINFKTLEQKGQIIISVINNSSISSNQDLAKLFQRFYQTEKASDGVGIGLSLVKELAILSHGNVVANTMDNGNIQFTVTLPIEKSFFNQSEIHFNEPTIIQPEEDITENEVKVQNKLPVLLIIEDDDDIRQFVKSIYKDSYKILEANNGKTGIEKAIKYIPDIIISDIMMPITDGIEVCNTLKNDQRTSHIPIILLTAKVGEENEITGLKTGADDYVTKPFNSEKLKIRVAKLIQLRQSLQKKYSKEFKLSEKEINYTSAEQVFFKNILEILDSNLTEPDFNSDVLVKKMLMSRMQLHRKLKALTGLSTSEFIRNERLKRATQLLQETDYTVSEVAYQIGFNTPSYFIKCFKDVYKCTPNDYQKSHN